MAHFTLIRGGELYAPLPLGRQDILVAGKKIVALAPRLQTPKGYDTNQISASGLTVVPGLIDGHVHVAGAGGEGGPQTRTSEVEITSLFAAGITSVLGMLGTDGVTRNLESVLMRTKALRALGISAWMLTGSYQVPPPTLTGDVARDIALFDEVIGVGEIAISDHRSSQPTVTDLIRLAKQARLGGLLGGKAGTLVLHMGKAPDALEPVRQALSQSDLPPSQLLPTHCNRNVDLLDGCKEFTTTYNGHVDLTTSSATPWPAEAPTKPARAAARLVESGVPLEKITFSSDAGGSLPRFDKQGRLVELKVGKPLSLFQEFTDLVRCEGFSLAQALLPVTCNAARLFGLTHKGVIQEGADADLLLLDDQLKMQYLLSRGKTVVRRGEVIPTGTSLE